MKKIYWAIIIIWLIFVTIVTAPVTAGLSIVLAIFVFIIFPLIIKTFDRTDVKIDRAALDDY